MYFNKTRQEKYQRCFFDASTVDSYLHISLAQQDSISTRIWFHTQQFIKVSLFKAVNSNTNKRLLG